MTTMKVEVAEATQTMRFVVLLDCPEDTPVEMRCGAVSDEDECLAELCFAVKDAKDTEGQEYLYIRNYYRVDACPPAEEARRLRDQEAASFDGGLSEHMKAVYVEITCTPLAL
jgi:hypothetical protein